MKNLKNSLILLLMVFLLPVLSLKAADGQDQPEHRTLVELLNANNLIAKDKSYLFMFVHPSYNVFDYSNSRDFQRSSIIEDGMWGYDLNSVGHVQFAWYCSTQNDVYSGAAGYTGEEDDQVSKMVEQGWGLTAMLSDFNDASLEPENYVVEDLQTKWHNEDIGYFWMAVEVDVDQCFESQFFLEDFIIKSPKTFSFTKDPDKYEGGVCSSVATSFFRAANTEYQEMIDATFRSVKISRTVLGNVPSAQLPENVDLPEFASTLPPKQINKVNLILKNIPFNPRSNYETFDFYDPELLIFMIKRLEAEYVPGPSLMAERKVIDLNVKDSKRNGNHFDRSQTGYRKNRYSTQYTPLSKDTDASYAKVHNVVKAFKRSNPRARIERKMLEGQAGIIINRN